MSAAEIYTGSPQAGQTPSFGSPYWWENGQDLPEFSTEAEGSYDLLVVGAGYTGLSAARAASDLGAKVLVVDADIPGKGASSRNGGMCGAHPRLPFSTLEKTYGRETALGLVDESEKALTFTKGLVDREAIDCSFQQNGRIVMAWTEGHFAKQKRFVEEMSSLPYGQVDLLSRDELDSHIKTDRYFGAIYFKDHAALQPRQFHDGLLCACLKRGVKIVANLPILELRQEGKEYLARAQDQTIRAKQVVLAGNGYLQGAFPWQKRRVFPLPSFIAVTEPLPPDQLAELAPGNRTMVETRARHSYYRLSPDGRRIIFGGRCSMVPISLDLAAKRLRETMVDIWPELHSVKITHCWTGNTGFSFSLMPNVGTHQGIHHAMGYCGSGVAVSPYLGMKAALAALDQPDKDSAFRATALKRSWMMPSGSPLFLYAANLWYRFAVDNWQNFSAWRGRRFS